MAKVTLDRGPLIGWEGQPPSRVDLGLQPGRAISLFDAAEPMSWEARHLAAMQQAGLTCSPHLVAFASDGIRDIGRPSAQLDPELTGQLERVFNEYLGNRLTQLALVPQQYLRGVIPEGFVDVVEDFPYPGRTLRESLAFEVYPHFTLLDFGSPEGGPLIIETVTIPFKLKERLFAGRIHLSRERMKWGGSPLLTFDNKWGSSVKYYILDGAAFHAERLRRFRLFYQRYGDEWSTFVRDNPSYVDWLAAQVGTDKKVLAIGCEDGIAEEKMQKEGRNTVTCVELLPRYATAARARGLEVIEGDAHFLPLLLGGRKYDTVAIFEAIGYFFPHLFFSGVKSALNNGGELLLVTKIYNDSSQGHLFHYEYYTLDKLRALLERFGFKIAEVAYIKDIKSYHDEERRKSVRLCEVVEVFDAEVSHVFIRARIG